MTLKKSILSKPEVCQLLPQKSPFVMVDELIAHSESSAITRFTIGAENVLVKKNCFTEAGILEHMAQSMALHSGFQQKDSKSQPKIGYVGAIKNAKIHQLPNVDDLLTTKVKIENSYIGMSSVSFETFVDERCIATATMTTVLAQTEDA